MAADLSQVPEPAASGPSAPLALTAGQGLLVLGGLVVALAGFIALNAALGIAEVWAGFLFLLYWAGIEQMDFGKLPAAIGGAVFGLLLAYLSHGLGDLTGLGEAGILLFLGLLLAVIYCQLLGRFQILINMMTMLYLTVGTIPVIQQSASIVGMASALCLAIVYFVAIAWVLTKRLTGTQST